MMVWGMRMPVGFGEFWPDGCFEKDSDTGDSGWSDRLNRHYYEQPPEEKKRLFAGGAGADGPIGYAYYVSQKFIKEVGQRGDGDPTPLTPIERNEAPRYFRTDKSYSVLGSLIKLNDRILAADETFKKLIEILEPGVHRFFPIAITMPKGATFPKPYFTLVIGQYFDAYSADKSDDTKKNLTGCAFSRPTFAGAHLWRDRRFPLVTCLSDELKLQIDALGLRVPKHYKMREV